MDEPLPPKVVSLEARKRAVTMADLTAWLGDGESGEYAVLDTFRRFLEDERRRARQRLVLLTTLCVVSVVVVTAVIPIVGILVYRHATTNTYRMEQALHATQEETDRIQRDARQALKAVESRSEELAKALKARPPVPAANTAIVPDQDLASLKQQVELLTQQNLEMEGEVALVRDLLPSLSSDIATVANMLDNMGSESPVEATTEAAVVDNAEQPAHTDEAMAPMLAHTTVTMQLLPAGTKTPIPWRLPIPE